MFDVSAYQQTANIINYSSLAITGFMTGAVLTLVYIGHRILPFAIMTVTLMAVLIGGPYLQDKYAPDLAGKVMDLARSKAAADIGCKSGSLASCTRAKALQNVDAKLIAAIDQECIAGNHNACRDKLILGAKLTNFHNR